MFGKSKPRLSISDFLLTGLSCVALCWQWVPSSFPWFCGIPWKCFSWMTTSWSVFPNLCVVCTASVSSTSPSESLPCSPAPCPFMIVASVSRSPCFPSLSLTTDFREPDGAVRGTRASFSDQVNKKVKHTNFWVLYNVFVHFPLADS